MTTTLDLLVARINKGVARAEANGATVDPEVVANFIADLTSNHYVPPAEEQA